MTRLLCPECRPALTHKLILLHAAADTLLVCGGAWESLPQWLRDAFEQAEKKGLEKRREIVREIQDHLKGP